MLALAALLAATTANARAQDTAPVPILPPAEVDSVDSGRDADEEALPYTGPDVVLDVEPDTEPEEPDVVLEAETDANLDVAPDEDHTTQYDAVSSTPPSPPADRFVACPDALLRQAWATVLTETALETFAVEQEVLRLCEKRQALINRILRQDAELAQLMEVPVRPVAAAADPVNASPVPASPGPASPEPLSGAAVAATPLPEPVTVAPVAGTGSALAAVIAPAATAGRWTHLVRYRVRVADGAWRAGIASTWNPPPPPPVVLDDGSVVPPGPPPPADPPVETIVAAGDLLPDGLIVTQIGKDDVAVRNPQGDMQRTLRNDPGPSQKRQKKAASCPTGTADARDLVYCTVRP